MCMRGGGKEGKSADLSSCGSRQMHQSLSGSSDSSSSSLSSSPLSAFSSSISTSIFSSGGGGFLLVSSLLLALSAVIAFLPGSADVRMCSCVCVHERMCSCECVHMSVCLQVCICECTSTSSGFLPRHPLLTHSENRKRLHASTFDEVLTFLHHHLPL